MKSNVIQRYMRSGFFLSDGAIALWSPSLGANLHKEFKKSNVCVGDVGFFTKQGGFLVLFNIFLSVEANIDLDFDPPPDLEPYPACFREDVSIVSMIRRSSYRHCDGAFLQSDLAPDSPRFDWSSSYCVHSLMSFRTYFASYRLQVPTTRKKKDVQRWGSVLDLPYGTWKDEMHPRMMSGLQLYIKRHANDWYLYYRMHPSGSTIPDGALKVVTSSYKCRTWALASCSTDSSNEIFAQLYKTSNSDIYYDWAKSDPVDGKTGPVAEETEEDEGELPNQCIAVEVCSFEDLSSKSKTARLVQSVSNLFGDRGRR